MRQTQTPRTLVLLAFLALGAGPVLAQQPAAPVETLEQADARVKRMVPQVLRDVVRIRGLSQKRTVPAGAMSAPQMREWMETEIAKDYPAAKFAQLSRAYVAMGLVQPGTDMREAMFDLLQDQVGGFYDPKKKRFYLIQTGTRGDSPTDQMVRMQDQLFRRFGLSNDHVVMAHELTHALQDQHFTLTGGLHELKHNDDRVLAAKCVVEGDATLLMQEYLFEKAPQMRVLMQMAEQRQAAGGDATQGNPAMANAPRALRVSLAYPYDGGKKFVQVAFKRGGWRAVDAVFGDFPTSTEQVLHPEKYYGAQRDEPVELIFETPGPVTGWKVLEDNCVGELMTRVVLQEGKVAQGRAERAAAGWDGDRYIVYAGPGGATVAVWASEWDARAEAGEFLAAMHTVMQAAGARDIEHSGGAGGSGYFGRLPDGTGFFVQQDDRRVVMVRGASMAATERIAGGVFATLREDEVRMPEPKAQPAVQPQTPVPGPPRVTGAGFTFTHPGGEWARIDKGVQGRPREVAFAHGTVKRARIVVETRAGERDAVLAVQRAMRGLADAGLSLDDVNRLRVGETSPASCEARFRVGKTRYVLIADVIGGQLITVMGKGPAGKRGKGDRAKLVRAARAIAKSLQAGD